MGRIKKLSAEDESFILQEVDRRRKKFLLEDLLHREVFSKRGDRKVSFYVLAQYARVDVSDALRIFDEQAFQGGLHSRREEDADYGRNIGQRVDSFLVDVCDVGDYTMDAVNKYVVSRMHDLAVGSWINISVLVKIFLERGGKYEEMVRAWIKKGQEVNIEYVKDEELKKILVDDKLQNSDAVYAHINQQITAGDVKGMVEAMTFLPNVDVVHNDCIVVCCDKLYAQGDSELFLRASHIFGDIAGKPGLDVRRAISFFKRGLRSTKEKSSLELRNACCTFIRNAPMTDELREFIWDHKFEFPEFMAAAIAEGKFQHEDGGKIVEGLRILVERNTHSDAFVEGVCRLPGIENISLEEVYGLIGVYWEGNNYPHALPYMLARMASCKRKDEARIIEYCREYLEHENAYLTGISEEIDMFIANMSRDGLEKIVDLLFEKKQLQDEKHGECAAAVFDALGKIVCSDLGDFEKVLTMIGNNLGVTKSPRALRVGASAMVRLAHNNGQQWAFALAYHHVDNACTSDDPSEFPFDALRVLGGDEQANLKRVYKNCEMLFEAIANMDDAGREQEVMENECIRDYLGENGMGLFGALLARKDIDVERVMGYVDRLVGHDSVAVRCGIAKQIFSLCQSGKVSEERLEGYLRRIETEDRAASGLASLVAADNVPAKLFARWMVRWGDLSNFSRMNSEGSPVDPLHRLFDVLLSDEPIVDEEYAFVKQYLARYSELEEKHCDIGAIVDDIVLHVSARKEKDVKRQSELIRTCKTLGEMHACELLESDKYRPVRKFERGASSIGVFRVVPKRAMWGETDLVLKVIASEEENEMEVRNCALVRSIPQPARAHFLVAYPEEGVKYDGKEVIAYTTDYTGMRLRELIDAGHLTPEQKVYIIYQLLEINMAMANQGIAHGDYNPNNIFVSENGWVTMGDNGIIMPINEYRSVSNRRYDPPAEFTHQASPNNFSLAIIIYELLTGKHLIIPDIPEMTSVEKGREARARIDDFYEGHVLERIRKEYAQRLDCWAVGCYDGKKRPVDEVMNELNVVAVCAQGLLREGRMNSQMYPTGVLMKRYAFSRYVSSGSFFPPTS